MEDSCPSRPTSARRESNRVGPDADADIGGDDDSTTCSLEEELALPLPVPAPTASARRCSEDLSGSIS